MFTEMTACSTKLCLFPQMTDFSPIQVLHVLYIIQVGTAVNTDKGNKKRLGQVSITLYCTFNNTLNWNLFKLMLISLVSLIAF